MTPLLSPESYRSASIYELEQKEIFQKSWFLAGFRHQLNGPLDWIAGDYAGMPYFIQLDEDLRLCGFLNKCSHRHSLIKLQDKGNGCIECPYHGWRYDNMGTPKIIPSKPKFSNLTKDTLNSLSLPKLKIETCGDFIFASFDNHTTDLSSQLGSLYDDLCKLSETIGAHIGRHNYSVNANWKLLEEIALEAYHIDWVHQDTFSRFNFKDPVINISSKASAFLLTSEKLEPRVDRLFSDRAFSTSGYYHLSLFPTFNVSTLFGINYAVITVNPVGPNQTNFTVHNFRCKTPPTSEIQGFKRDEYYRTSHRNSDALNMEDIAIVESQQKFIQAAKSSGVLSDEESRILHFQQLHAERIF